ncbi:Hypothetical predicted protein, partial [Pelobates cultripes]
MINEINTANKPVKLTMTANSEDVDFLDVHIYGQGHKLAYSLYTKPTDRNTLLYAENFHPTHLKSSLPYSQFLR